MTRELDDLQRALACLAHVSRFRIVLHLLERPWFVSELARSVKLSQSCTTRHLQAMTRAGLVRSARTGRRVFFEVRHGAPALAAFEDRLSAATEGPGDAPEEAPTPRRPGGRLRERQARKPSAGSGQAAPDRRSRTRTSGPAVQPPSSPPDPESSEARSERGSLPPESPDSVPRPRRTELEDFLL